MKNTLAAPREALIIHTPTTHAQHPVYIYVGRQSPAGRNSVLGALRWAFGVVGVDYLMIEAWGAINYGVFAGIKQRLIESGKAPATINHALSVIRGVLREAKRLGIITRDTLEDCLEVRNVKTSNEVLAGREVLISEAGALFGVCGSDKSPAGVRDAAILALLWGAGLRRQEVAALPLHAVDISAGRVVVVGKGNKTREVFVAGGALEALRAWVSLRGSEAGALFGAISKAGRISTKYTTPQAIYNALAKRRAQAGVVSCSPHDMRRSFVGNLLQVGVDINTVRGMCGHASITTTARYDRRGSAEKKRAATLVHTPYSAG